MGKKHIKSGPEVVEVFLTAMGSNPSIDKATIKAIHSLWRESKLTHTRLQQELDNARQAKLSNGKTDED